MDEQFTEYVNDWVPRIAVGLVLVTMAVLVLVAILSFLGGPLDDKPAAVIKKAADAAAASTEA